MKTRIIHTKIWRDGWFRSLNRPAKILFLYLISCETINLCGIFELPDDDIATQTGLTKIEIEAARGELKGKVEWFCGWWLVRNAQKHANYTGPKNDAAREREKAEVPDEVIAHFDALPILHRYTIGVVSATADTPRNQKSEIRNQKLEEKEIESVAATMHVEVTTAGTIYAELLDYCAASGKSYRSHTAALRNWIRRRLAEGKVSRQTAPTVITQYEVERASADTIKRVRSSLVSKNIITSK